MGIETSSWQCEGRMEKGFEHRVSCIEREAKNGLKYYVRVLYYYSKYLTLCYICELFNYGNFQPWVSTTGVFKTRDFFNDMGSRRRSHV